MVLVNIMNLVYNFSMGLEQASCALVGRYLGRNDPVQAMKYYKSFIIVNAVIICSAALFVYLNSHWVINVHTDIVSIQ